MRFLVPIQWYAWSCFFLAVGCVPQRHATEAIGNPGPRAGADSTVLVVEASATAGATPPTSGSVVSGDIDEPALALEGEVNSLPMSEFLMICDFPGARPVRAFVRYLVDDRLRDGISASEALRGYRLEILNIDFIPPDGEMITMLRLQPQWVESPTGAGLVVAGKESVQRDSRDETAAVTMRWLPPVLSASDKTLQFRPGPQQVEFSLQTGPDHFQGAATCQAEVI